MEKYNNPTDITTFYITASSFPDGILPAFEKLESLLPTKQGRQFFGISRPENCVIVYKAGVKQSYQGEGASLGCETFVIGKGEYASIIVDEFMKFPERIGQAFTELIHTVPGLDPQGYCIEIYLEAERVRCMIPMDK